MSRTRRVVVPQRVVGIGASAGGLDSLKQLVSRLPAESGLAFVVLQHLPPSQTGQLASLLARGAKVPVIDAKANQCIEPNTLVVVPPHTSARLNRGALVLRTAKSGAGPALPIDELFLSLSAALGSRAIGVLLSGTGHDGTEGLRAIQAGGGVTFVQDPTTAQFDEMPRSAIAAGVAEVVAPPAQIGDEVGEIASIAAHPERPKGRPAATPPIERILDELREASGIDFTSYKRTTIERRLARRLVQLDLRSLEDYAAYLREHPVEAATVYEDLLIHVTEFFRDPLVLAKLVDEIVPVLVRDKPADAPLRVWVPGCSTGQEVYSLAMLLLEKLGDGRPIQLFGTDLSERAIDIARRGQYPEAISAQVNAERLARFFTADGNGYRIHKAVRERCVFVRHDLVADPPFSKLDLISCRNVLIYLGASLQQRVIPIFHYALCQPGYLLLGRSESIGSFDALFDTIDADARIYARKPGRRTALTFPVAGQLGRQPLRRGDEAIRSTLDVQRDVDYVLLARYAPACVLVDDKLEVVQYRGRTAPYLEPPPGQPQLSVLKMARGDLASELPLAVQRARRTNAAVRRDNLAIRDHGQTFRFHLEVVPLRGATGTQRYFLVVFEPAGPPTIRRGKATRRKSVGDSAQIVRQELAATKEYLQSVLAEHLATREELGVTNEELQSANEELQSSNEELQTAKEELQSANEELETVNDELKRGNDQLRAVNDDLLNVLASVELAIIIVDTERRIRRFTPKARRVMKLIPGDIGRPIADLQPSVATTGLDDAIVGVIESLAVHEAEVRHSDGTMYRMQIRPYHTSDHKIGGAVITFVDITALRAASDYTSAIVETVPTPLAVIDDRTRIQSANRAFHAEFATTAADTAGRLVFDVGTWRGPSLRGALDNLIATGTAFDALEVQHTDARGDRVLLVNASPIPAIDGRKLVLLGLVDITARHRLETARTTAARERDAFLDAVSHELRTPLSAILLWAEVLRELQPSDPRRLEAIETITQSARAEAQLVDDLLELALSRSGELTVTVEPVNATDVVASVVESSRQAAADKQIALDVELAPVSKIAADARRLRQITSHLVSNALKFTPAGGRISVSLALDDGVMELRVQDTGPGIPREILPHVFEPFTQADRSLSRAHRGLGIGLALVRHFVERQGGTIAVDSPGDNLGTKFTVRIPART